MPGTARRSCSARPGTASRATLATWRAADGAPHHGQAGLAAPDVQLLRLVGRRQAGLDRVAGLGQRRMLQQVQRRRSSSEVGLAGSEARPPDSRSGPRTGSARRSPDGPGRCGTPRAPARRPSDCASRRPPSRCTSSRTRVLCTWPRSATSSWMSRIVEPRRDAVQLRPRACPSPAPRSTSPSTASSRSARLTVMRLMPNCCISAASLGTGSPGLHSPLRDVLPDEGLDLLVGRHDVLRHVARA